VAERLVAITRAEKSSTIVVGLPLDRSGAECEQSNITRIFAQLLCDMATPEIPNCRVWLFDERFSSREAEVILMTSPELTKYLDSVAACAILDHFFHDEGKGAEFVAPGPDVAPYVRRAPPPRPPPPPSRPPDKRLLKYLESE